MENNQNKSPSSFRAYMIEAGKQFIHGKPHFYIKRCLFGCPKPCHRTDMSCKIVVWIKLEDYAR